MNIYQKIARVMNDVQYLSKDGKIEYKSTNYKAITEGKVTSVVRKSLIEHGLVIFPVEQDHKKEGTLTTVNVKYKIVNIDIPEDSITVVSSGTGADTQDKGVGKAMTYAYKYMLLRTFAIPTGEDPDKISNAEIEDKIQKETLETQIKTINNICGEHGLTLKKLCELNNLDDGKLTLDQTSKLLISLKAKFGDE